MRYGTSYINGAPWLYIPIDDSDPPKMLPGSQPVVPRPPTEEEYQEAYAEDWSFNTQRFEYLECGAELLTQPKPPKPPTEDEYREAYHINQRRHEIQGMYLAAINAMTNYPEEGSTE